MKMIKISDWYCSLAEYTFPTIFLPLTAEERLVIAKNGDGKEKQHLWKRIQHAFNSLSGGLIINADCCAPTDSIAFQRRRILHTPISAWKQLVTSEKVCLALENNITDKLAIRPYRRMDNTREFRIFIRDGKFVCASQYNLSKHFSKLEKRKDIIKSSLTKFINEDIMPNLPFKSAALDVYLKSDGSYMLIDINDWGGETAPLLARSWESLDAMDASGTLLLLAKPTMMGGDISVSF
jgi:hypothetical protein